MSWMIAYTFSSAASFKLVFKFVLSIIIDPILSSSGIKSISFFTYFIFISIYDKF